MNKPNTYWQKRFVQMEEAINNKGLKTISEIEAASVKAQRSLEGQIQSWYGRFADNNKITIAEARKLLTASELKELKWNVNEYIKYGHENGMGADWMKELENASAKYHISRLEALKLQTQQTMEVLYGNETDIIDRLMRDTYTQRYYQTAYEIQKGFNVGWDIISIDQRKLDKIISKPWAVDGKNFSERLWGSKQQLINEVHTQLTQMCILGQSPDKAINNLAKKMKTTKNQAGRLIMTESSYFSSAAQKDCFKYLDVEKYEIVATLDNHTSVICQDLDGHVFEMKDYEPGITAPPFHVYCRSCTCPWFEDDYDVESERAARDENGQTYYVSDKLKYNDWKEKYVVDSISKNDLKLYDEYKTILGNNAPKSIEDFVKMKYNNVDWNKFKAYSNSIKIGELTPLADYSSYQNMSEDINNALIGKVTKNGIVITGKSNHFIARTIGSVEQKRNGVGIQETIKALKEPITIGDIKENINGRSQKFISDAIVVTVNPDTGKLIQVNPRIKRKKVNS